MTLFDGEPGDVGDEARARHRQKRSHGTPREPRAPELEEIPAGTEPSICTGHTKPGGTCRAEVFWITRPRRQRGRPIPGTSTRVPVDADVAGGQRPDSWTTGRGHNHYTTCPDADKF